MVKLFSPIKIRGIEFKNRIMVSPMCQYSGKDGFADDWHLVHYGSRAVGGAGIIMFEATAVSPEGRISTGDLGLWKEEHIAPLKRIADFIVQQDSIPGIQLAHAGRKASMAEPWDGDKLIPVSEGGWKTLAPSQIAFTEDYDTPDALTSEGIKKVISDFKSASARALKSGFSVIEIHAAHGYLIHEFLSPLSNKRTDKYGGSFDNRIRLLIEIVDAIRSEFPDKYPLFVRLSVTDWAEGGWTTEESVALSKILKIKGVDLIDCSSGGVITGIKIPIVPGYQVPLAETIRKQAGILTGSVGLITKPDQAEKIIADGQADIIVMAREFLRNPYFPLYAANELGYDISYPKQYTRVKPKK